jgi:FHA domain-containing protein
LTLFYRAADVIDSMRSLTAAPPRNQTTEPLDSPDTEPILDGLALLDHRTRQRAIGRRLAPFGHYLAFDDDGEEWLVPIEAKVTHVGRGLTSHVRIEEQRVSRSHAILVRHGHTTRLLDNRSANGTFVNGRRIVATNIADGDVIRIGPVVMTYLQVT